jgi:hypothetical protein
MARTIDTIFNDMKGEAVRLATDANNADMLAMLNNTSKVAIWRLWFYIIAFAVWSLEKLWDAFQLLINSIIANQTPHTLRWYRTKALAFQYGFNLIPDTDKFDDVLFADDEIEASKVVKYAAVNETTIDGRRVLLIKVATLVNGELSPLNALQEAALTAYFEDVKDAGVPIIIYNRLADVLRATVDFYYNPLLLDGNGNRLDGLGANPVIEAANNYLLSLPFNGEFSNAAFIDALQDAFGASDRDVFLRSMERKTGDSDYVSVANTFIPDAGYVRFEANGLTINYIPHVAA